MFLVRLGVASGSALAKKPAFHVNPTPRSSRGVSEAFSVRISNSATVPSEDAATRRGRRPRDVFLVAAVPRDVFLVAAFPRTARDRSRLGPRRGFDSRLQRDDVSVVRGGRFADTFRLAAPHFDASVAGAPEPARVSLPTGDDVRWIRRVDDGE